MHGAANIKTKRGRSMVPAIDYFAKSLKVTQGHSTWHHLIDRKRVPIGVPLYL